MFNENTNDCCCINSLHAGLDTIALAQATECVLQVIVESHLDGVHPGVSGIVDAVRAARRESHHIARPDWEPTPVAVSAA